MAKNNYFWNGLFTTAVIGIFGRMEFKKLERASDNPKKYAARTLRRILFYAKDSEYGRKHNFAEILKTRDADELFRLYRENVRTHEYEDFRPLVERHKNGEAGVLFPGKPMMYATTSGTTNDPKWIPLTRRYIFNVYKKMTRAWLYNFMLNKPKAFYGGMLTVVGKLIEGYAPDGTVYGSVSGLTRADAPFFVRHLYACPDCVYAIPDYAARYYTLMRVSIEKDLHMILTANPSTIVEMQNNAAEWYDEYVKDIENGTLSDKVDIPEEYRKVIHEGLKPNPERAQELRELKRKYGTPLFKHYWPNLQILSTWKCGNTKIFLDRFKDSFPEGMLHQEIGYFSSECRFGMVVDDTNYTVLFPHMHYYEFVAEEDFDAATRGEDVRYWQTYELEEGKRYCAYVTTYAGLYRYNMNDLVEVGPKFHNTPRVFMIQKVNGLVSITGEKLHESQFYNSVREAASELGLGIRFSIGFAVPEESRYHFYFDFTDDNVSQEQADKLAARVDEILKSKNIEYESKRDSFRLKDPVAHRLVSNAFEKFKTARVAEGMRDGQFKLNLLLQDEKRHAGFKQLVKE